MSTVYAAPLVGAGVVVSTAAAESLRLQLANMTRRADEAAGQPTT